MNIFQLTDHLSRQLVADKLADKQVQKEILEADAESGAQHILALIDHVGVILLNESLQKKGYKLNINHSRGI